MSNRRCTPAEKMKNAEDMKKSLKEAALGSDITSFIYRGNKVIQELTLMNSFIDEKIGFPVYDAAMFADNVTPKQIKQLNNEEETQKQPSIISVESECETIFMEVEKESQKYQAEISRREDEQSNNKSNEIVLQPPKFIAPEILQPLRVANFSRVNQLFSDSDPESELQPLPPSPPPEQNANPDAMLTNNVSDIAQSSAKKAPKINQGIQMVKEVLSSEKEPIIEGRSISSDDGFDPTSARKKIPVMNGPIQTSAHPFGINRSPKKTYNFSSGRGRPTERPKGGLKSLTASAQAQRQRLKKSKVLTKITKPRQEKENAKPLVRPRTPSPKRILNESDKTRSQNNSSTSFGGSASSQQTSSSLSDEVTDEIDPSLPHQLLFWGSKVLGYSEETGLGFIIGEVTEILNGPGLFILKYSAMSEHRDYKILQKRLNDTYGHTNSNQLTFNPMRRFNVGCYAIYHHENENYVRAKIIPNGYVTSSTNPPDFKLFLVDLGIQLSTFDRSKIFTYPESSNTKNNLVNFLRLPECSFPCFLTGIRPTNNMVRYPKIVCDRFSDLVQINRKIAVNIFLPVKKQRSRLDPSMRQKYSGMLPLSIVVKANANGYIAPSTLSDEMRKENTALLEETSTFAIDLNSSEKVLIGSTGKRGPNKFYNNYFTTSQDLPTDYVVEMPHKTSKKLTTSKPKVSNPSSPRSFNDSNVTTSLSPPPLSQYGSKMVSNRSSSNDTSSHIIHDASQQSILNLPMKTPNQYLKHNNFYNTGQMMPVMIPPLRFPNGSSNQIFSNQDISNVPQILPAQNFIVNNFYLPYGIDPYSYTHSHPQNMPPQNSHSNRPQRPTGPNSYGRNFHNFPKQ